MENCSRRRGCPPLRRNLGPEWGRGGPQGSGCSSGPRTLLSGTSDRPGPVWMTTQVWALLDSAAPSSGCRLPSADGSAEVLSASVSVASAGLRLRWTEGEPQLHPWRLRMKKKRKHQATVPSWDQTWLETFLYLHVLMMFFPQADILPLHTKKQSVRCFGRRI